MCELFVRAQLVNHERKYKPIWSIALLPNYDVTKANNKQSNVGDDTDTKDRHNYKRTELKGN